MRFLSPMLAVLLLGLTGLAGLGAPLNYDRDVAPIFRAYCAGCHNDADQEGSFSLETFAHLRTGGDKGDPIHPGRPDESLLIRSIEGHAKPAMPPRDEPQVPEAERQRLRRWIAEGATGPGSDVSILSRLVVPVMDMPAAASVRRPVTALEFSPNGEWLAVASSGRVELRTTPSRSARRVLEGIPGKVNAVHISPDGRVVTLAAGVPGLNGVVQQWDVTTGRKQREFTGHRDAVQDAVVSPDGRCMVSGGYDRSLRFWAMESGRCVRTNTVHNGAVFRLAFHPDGAVVASASADQTVKLWRLADGVRLDTLNQPQGELTGVVFTPDGSQVLAAGADRRIHQWKVVSTNEPAVNPPVASRFAHEAAITALAISRDGRLLASAAADRTLKLWRLPELEEVRAWTNQPDVVSAIAFDPRGPRLVVGRMDGSVESIRIQSAGMPRAAAVASVERAPTARSIGTAMIQRDEAEPNDQPSQAMRISWPTEIHGTLGHPGDVDLFRFSARAGEAVTLAIEAAQKGSKLDSRLEVLTAEGHPVPQVRLQAVRDSWFTFRGKDSETADDFRLQNWAEMELNEYLYANGEVVQLWLYPRGPDSGFKVYPGEGRRQPLFSTTALSHALNEPCYIVRPLAPGARLVPNGLPVFQLNYENDDDPSRRAGSDSVLQFVAPTAGDYLVRVTDIRGFGGGTNYFYTLAIREPRPGFSVKLETSDLSVSPGSARELRFVATRDEGFAGPIRIDLEQLPPGFRASTPVEIEAGQIRASAILFAATNAVAPDAESVRRIFLRASARIGGREVTHPTGPLGSLKLGKAPAVTLEILPGPDRNAFVVEPGQPLEVRLRPGQTVQARVRAERRDFKDRIELGGEDCGRNLPHGVYVDNVGLNGLLIVEGQVEREFFITASPIARPGERFFHLRTSADGGQCSPVVRLRVLPALQAGSR